MAFYEERLCARSYGIQAVQLGCLHFAFRFDHQIAKVFVEGRRGLQTNVYQLPFKEVRLREAGRIREALLARRTSPILLVFLV